VVAVSIPIAWVDAFSDAAFGGNPAAVCILENILENTLENALDDALDDALMQSIASELGLSETAFVTRTKDPAVFGLRWFTPTVEVDLCGHATLATAHVLRESGLVDGTASLTFHTRSGPLAAAFEGDLVVLDFPADPMTPSPLPGALAGQWQGADVVETGHTAFFTFVALSSASLVHEYEPDLAAVAATGSSALLLTAAGDPGSGADYVLRVFGPNVGIPEDPGTGAAQCTAGPYWSRAFGRTTLVARQLSSRGAVLRVQVDGKRVRIAGHATTVLTGHLC
jgi:predicted PhzF superfamily epimerase YddE/YHI9